MSFHAENSNTVTLRANANRHQVIGTDLSVSESLGEFDSDSYDSLDERTTVRERSRRDDVDLFPQSEETLEDGPRFPGPVSIFSNSSLVEDDDNF
jgi:hypothetical protein